MIHDLDYYRKIQGLNGTNTRKEADLRLIKSELTRDFYNSIDCESVEINGEDSDLLITKSADATIKNITSKPDDALYLGDIVNWCDTNWIVDTIDADNRITNHGKMRRCNVTLKWLDENRVVHAYPGFCEDATKYGEGVTGGKIMQVPDFQIKVKVHLDEHSVKINRNKRFLLDASQYLPQIDVSGEHPSAFTVTRRNVLSGSHNGHGYAELTLVESAYSENDNPTLMIADYYNQDDVYVLTVSDDSNLTVARGKTYTLTCSATLNGIALDQTIFLFTSSDTSVATVSTAGKITGISNGTCVILVKAGNATQQINLTVEASSSTASIKIFAGDATIVYGQSKRIEFAAYQSGVEVSTTFSTSVSSLLGVASITSSGPNYVVITTLDDEDLIGEEFTLTVSSESLSASTEQKFTVGGWF